MFLVPDARRGIHSPRKSAGPGLNTYAAGGYLAWSISPEHPVYIDGRDTLYGPPHLARLTEMEFGSLDSPAWQDEVSKYNINTVVLALTQYDGVPPALLFQLCNSKTWSPVYLDELSAVFVRHSSSNDAFLRRFPGELLRSFASGFAGEQSPPRRVQHLDEHRAHPRRVATQRRGAS